MAEYVEWENKKYSEIPEQDRAQEGEIFICRTPDIDNPFEDWDCIVGIMEESGPEALGKFKKIGMARAFAKGL